ncbi:class I SAM-dependent methyltransferase [bacterium]|nr:class I SAM-dependent methyltransferase [bacterium]
MIDRLRAEQTDAYRLFSGSAEGRPGLTVDRYGELLLVQNFFEPLREEERRLLEAFAGREGLLLNIWPKFDKELMKAGSLEARQNLKDTAKLRTCLEQGQKFYVDARSCGCDPYLYLDFRCGRRWLRAETKRRLDERQAGASEPVRALNCFAYTCTAGVAASQSGAVKVFNVDFGGWCLDLGRKNARLNSVRDKDFLCWQEDFFPVIRQLAGLDVKGRGARRRKYLHVKAQQFDIIVLDPPTLAKSIFGKVDIVNDYQALLKPCLLALAPGGALLAVNHSSEVSGQGWREALLRCADKNKLALTSCEFLSLDEDFPAFAGSEHPVKVAVLRR